MARNLELDRLRAEVRRRQHDAAKKISRIRRVNGIEIAGTQYDPRRSPEAIKSYNKNQLTNYLNKLNNFQARGTGFMRGAEGTVLPTNKVRYYQGLEKRWNKKVERHDKSVGDTFIPFAGMTVAGRKAMRNKNLPFAGAESTNKPYAETHRKMSNVRGEAALDKLIKSMEKKLDHAYTPKQIAEQRKQYNKLVKGIGVKGLNKRARDLTDYQWNMFWNESGAADATGLAYFHAKSTSESIRQNRAGIFDAKIAEIDEALEWASKLPKNKRVD